MGRAIDEWISEYYLRRGMTWADWPRVSDGSGFALIRGHLERIPHGQVGYVHVCGFGWVDGSWRCVQDYWARGMAPETCCREGEA